MFSCFLQLSEQETPQIRMFLAGRKPKTTVFTMFLDSGSQNHGIYKVFWPAPGKNTGMHAGFTMLQDVVSIFEKVKNTVNYNVLALLLGRVGSAEPPG